MVYFLENYVGNDDWQCCYNELDVLTYVILSKVEKHKPYGLSVGTTECMMLQPRCCTD